MSPPANEAEEIFFKALPPDFARSAIDKIPLAPRSPPNFDVCASGVSRMLRSNDGTSAQE